MALAWLGLPLALTPQLSIISLLPFGCFVVLFLYGRKAVDFYFSKTNVSKPVISMRALVGLSLCYCFVALLALSYSPRLQPPPFPRNNVIRYVAPCQCHPRPAHWQQRNGWLQRVWRHCSRFQLSVRAVEGRGSRARRSLASGRVAVECAATDVGGDVD